MEIGEASRKEQLLEVSLIPTTPVKPNLPRSVPICPTREGNQLNQENCLGTSPCCNSSDDCVVACFESSPNADIRSSQQDQAAPAAAASNVAGDNVGTCEQPSLDTLSISKNVRFANLLALAEAASAHSNAKHADNEVKNPISTTSNSQFKGDPVANPTSTLLSHHNLCTDQITNHANYDNPQEPQGTSYTACGSKTISQFAPPTPGKAIRTECRQVAGMQIIMEEKDQEEEETNARATNLDKNKTPHNQELSDLVIDLSFPTVSSPFKENHNLDNSGSHSNDLNRTPQQKPRRKKHRPKVITEGKPKRTRKPITPKPPQSKENKTVKRTYVRRKGVNNTSTTTPTAVTGESTEPMMPESNKESFRRSFNFHRGEQSRDVNSSCRENATIHLDLGKGTGVRIADMCVGLPHDLNLSAKQALNDYMSLAEDTQAPSIARSNSNPPGAKPNAHSVKNSKRKDHVTSLNGQSQPKENQTVKRTYVRRKESNKTSTTPPTAVTGEFTELIMPESNKKSCRRSLNFHIGGQPRDENSACRENATKHLDLGKGIGARDAEMYVGLAYDINLSTKQAQNDYMSLPEDTQATSITLSKSYPPGAKSNAHSVKNNSKRKDQVTSVDGHQNTASVTSNYFNSSNCGIWPTVLQMGGSKRQYFSTIEYADAGSFNVIGAHYNELHACQVKFGDQLPNVQKKRRSKKGQISSTSNSDRQLFDNTEAPQTCIKPIVAEMHTSLTRNKRTNEKSILVSSAYSSTNEMQLHYKFVLDNYHLYLDKSSGVAHEVSRNSTNTMDALTEQFRHLEINTEARDLAFHEQNALIPYNQKNQKNKALVHGGGTIIHWESAFEHIRKRRLRPKVDLDEETNRVWQLLLLDINSQGVDGTDEDKAKWWEEERRVFRGRADSFIARMHLVQGDRRFSQWKGSVVDSVIGVFLTQNVSDHLSSSAFMSLAARFPLKSSSKGKTYHEEGTSLVVSEQQVQIVKSEENMKYDHGSMTKDIMEHSAEKEAVNSNDYCRITSTAVREPHYSMLSGPTETTTWERQEKSCYGGVRKELNDIVSSQCSVISSQISGDFSIDQNPEKIGSCSDSNSEVEELSSTAKYNMFDNSTSFSKLLEMASSTMLLEVNSQGSKSTGNLKDAYDQSMGMKHNNQTKTLEKSDVIIHGSLEAPIIPSCEHTLKLTPDSGILDVRCFDPFKTEALYGFSKNKDENDMNKSSIQTTESQASMAHSQSMSTQLHLQGQSNNMQQSLFNSSGQTQDLMQKARDLDSADLNYKTRSEIPKRNAAPIKPKSEKLGKKKQDHFNWDNLRKQAQAKKGIRERTANTMDSLDWDAVRCADVNEIANAIKDRGMNNVLAERIKNFLNRLVEEHGGIDLEWLREVPPDQAKEYLLSIRGLGLKSVECVRLLTLHHLAFPVDTNVGRIAVRLGWVPLQPLPESLQLHLLEMYPLLESIQKYLWPRLCKLDQKTLYELHYQMITFGKVFCTKSKPNCNACPMRGECRHFASAFASARLALPGPEQNSIISTAGNNVTDQNPSIIRSQLPLPLPLHTNQEEEIQQTEVSRQLEAKSEINICQPIIEEPATPEPECTQVAENDIEDAFYEDPCEIPTIKLNFEEFTLNLQSYMQENMELQASEMSKALVALTPEAASIPTPKLKNVSQLRTEHCVYELPDSHPLLQGWDKREPDDPCRYLLAIWTPGETENSIKPPESKCSSQECGQLCNEKECFPCNSIREANLQIVRGTFLIPCRTAMRGSFPLNGTYFQVNEVFADHDSSLNPINVPRSWIWNLNRKTVYFGTSIPSIFKGLSTTEIQQCFWRERGGLNDYPFTGTRSQNFGR